MCKFEAGFVGCGNMGFALASAAAKKVTGEKIILSCKTAEHAKEKAERLGAAYGQAEDAARDARFVFIGVKPGNLYEVSEKVSPVLKERTDEFIVVSMLAGVGLKTLGDVFGRKAKIIRIMPNTPALVGEGLTLFCTSAAVTQEEKKEFSELLGFSGVIDEISENLIDAASAVSGCGPAFLYMFADALSEGAVYCGLKKEKALYYALTMIKGSCALALETKKHPGVLTDEVCSPGGSTIEGVRTLEDAAFSGNVMEAVINAYKKTLELGRRQ